MGIFVLEVPAHLHLESESGQSLKCSRHCFLGSFQQPEPALAADTTAQGVSLGLGREFFF